MTLKITHTLILYIWVALLTVFLVFTALTGHNSAPTYHKSTYNKYPSPSKPTQSSCVTYDGNYDNDTCSN